MKERFLSLDAFRGFLILLLVAGEFGIQELADVGGWRAHARYFNHVEWEGLVLWDAGQAAFLWVVGVAVSFSVAGRLRRGATPGSITKSAAIRAITLFVLSQLLMSIKELRPHFQLTNVLVHIAVGYFACVLIGRLRLSMQVIVGLTILALYQSIFFLFPGGDGAFSRGDNIGARLDAAVFAQPNPEGFVSIAMVGGIVSTLLGFWSGRFLRGREPGSTAAIFAAAALVTLGLADSIEPVIPVVRKLWTASYVLQSFAWTLLVSAAFLVVVDVLGLRRLVAPFVVLGSNPIFVYCAFMLLAEPLDLLLWEIADGFEAWGAIAPLVRASIIVGLLYVPALMLYRKRVFLRV